MFRQIDVKWIAQLLVAFGASLYCAQLPFIYRFILRCSLDFQPFTLFLLSCTCAVLSLLLQVISLLFEHPGPKRLPGPKGLPWIGTALQISLNRIDEWHQKYGPIFETVILGQRYVTIGSESIAVELLKNRGSIYSDRHYNAVLRGQPHLPMLRMGESWRRQRKLFYQFTQACTINAPTTGSIYAKVVTREVEKLVRNLVGHPEDWQKIIDGYVSSISLALTYGKEIRSYNDHNVRRIVEHYRNFENASRPDYYLVNLFPILRHLPAWLAPFKNSGQEYLQAERAYLFIALAQVQHKLDAHIGTNDRGQKKPEIDSASSNWCLAQENWQNEERWDAQGLTLEEAAYTLGSFATAALASSPAVLKTFFLAMLHHPEWQQRLQDEVDRVYRDAAIHRKESTEQLWTKKETFPVARAIVKEVLRWRPTLPTGFPHILTQDDVYDGYTIKKGTMVLWSQWHMAHDPSLYADPHTFNPARHLPCSTSLPLSLANDSSFGFGRRACPGWQQAEDMLLAAVISIARSLELNRERDEKGEPVGKLPWVEYEGGSTTRPRWFKVEIRRRGREDKET